MTQNKKLGNWGEALAKDYLLHRCYKIIAANQRFGRFEVDLIAEHKGRPIFIEVKTRIKTTQSQDDNPLTAKQAKNFQKVLAAYCFKNRVNSDAIRYDLIIINVERQKKIAQLKHYREII